MNILFSADHHFDHQKIIEYCKRPFSDVNEMNEKLIKNWNSVVNPNDIVYYLGDFAMTSSVKRMYELRKRLNGRIIFISGCHDLCAENVFDEYYKYMHVVEIEKQTVVLCHYPMRSWPKSHYGSIQLYGHHHGRLRPLENQLDVGVDANNFKPISWEQVQVLVESTERKFDW